jgi:hypothetical protein
MEKVPEECCKQIEIKVLLSSSTNEKVARAWKPSKCPRVEAKTMINSVVMKTQMKMTMK